MDECNLLRDTHSDNDHDSRNCFGVTKMMPAIVLIYAQMQVSFTQIECVLR